MLKEKRPKYDNSETAENECQSKVSSFTVYYIVWIR